MYPPDKKNHHKATKVIKQEGKTAIHSLISSAERQFDFDCALRARLRHRLFVTFVAL